MEEYLVVVVRLVILLGLNFLLEAFETAVTIVDFIIVESHSHAIRRRNRSLMFWMKSFRCVFWSWNLVTRLLITPMIIPGGCADSAEMLR